MKKDNLTEVLASIERGEYQTRIDENMFPRRTAVREGCEYLSSNPRNLRPGRST